MDAAINTSASTVTSAMADNTTDLPFTVDTSYVIRATFYGLTMKETFIEHAKDVPNIPLLVFPILTVMTLVEMLVLRAQGRGECMRLHNTVINFSTGILHEASRVFLFRGIELSAYVWVFTNLRFLTLPWDSFYTYVFALLSVDCCYYWWHRFSHELSFMWAGHYPHHSSEDFNLSVGARVAPTVRLAKLLPFISLAVVGLPPSTFLLHNHLGFVWGLWVHCEVWPKTQKVIPGLGHIIEFIVVTPSHHRVHHGVNKYCIDKNYGNFLIIWDRIFGTFAEEREDDPLIYGTLSLKDNNHILGIQADGYRDLWSRICTNKGVLNKIKTIVYGPGWRPGKPRLGDYDEIPDVTGKKKYSFDHPKWFSLYLAAHCFFVLILHCDAAPRVMELSTVVQLVTVGYIFLSYAGLGGLYSAHQGSMWIEPVRLFASVPLIFMLPMYTFKHLPTFIVTANLLSLLAWPAVKGHVLSEGKKMD